MNLARKSIKYEQSVSITEWGYVPPPYILGHMFGLALQFTALMCDQSSVLLKGQLRWNVFSFKTKSKPRREKSIFFILCSMLVPPIFGPVMSGTPVLVLNPLSPVGWVWRVRRPSWSLKLFVNLLWSFLSSFCHATGHIVLLGRSLLWDRAAEIFLSLQSWCMSSGIHLITSTQGCQAEHRILTGCVSIVFILPISCYNVAADQGV